MGFTLDAASSTNVGKRRYNNEDNFYFDGMCMGEQNDGTYNGYCYYPTVTE